MIRFLATYDLTSGNPSPYTSFIKNAKAQGWNDHSPGNMGVDRLPYTTLIGEFISSEAAFKSLDAALERTRRDVGWHVRLTHVAIAAYSEIWTRAEDRIPNPSQFAGPAPGLGLGGLYAGRKS